MELMYGGECVLYYVSWNALHDWVLDIIDTWRFMPILAVVYVILGQPLYP